MKKFFVACNLHFEEELQAEIKEVWPFLMDLDGRSHTQSLNILDVHEGGVLLEAPLHLGLQLNFFLKTANRILLRIGEKKIRDFPALYQWLKKSAQDPSLVNQDFSLEVSCKKSRLNNEKRVIEIAQEIFKIKNETAQSLYIRFFDDLCSLSLDTTGELLYKRSNKEVGKAPVRESLAAFCVRKMIAGASPNSLQEIQIIDPLCGTGTLLFEAKNLLIPQLERQFAFQENSICPKIFRTKDFGKNYISFPKLFADGYGFDRDEKVISVAQQLATSKNTPELHFRVQDLAQATPMKSGKNWVVSNIPYGERVKMDFELSELLHLIVKNYQPERLGLLMSESQSKSLKSEELRGLDYKQAEIFKFSNGGIAVAFLILNRNSLE